MNRFDELRKRKDKAFKSVDLEINNMKDIAFESKRVANVAHNSKIILNNIDEEFSKITKLTKLDISFLFFATALQCVRQYCLTSFKERVDDKASAKEAHEKEKNIYNKYFEKSDPIGDKKRYYSPLSDIISKGVPYDVQDGSKKFDLGGSPNKGLNGNTHRFRTLGHDPILGWIFGTANIMTNTLTDWKFSTYHIKELPLSNGVLRNGLYQHASTEKMLEKTYVRIKTEPEAFAAALIKQALHYESDIYSTVGLPIPMISSSISPQFSEKLANYGLDLGNVMTVGKQSTCSAFINMLIAMIHRLFYNENTYESEKIYEVKTRKILSYSNTIASASNIIYVAINAYLGNKSEIRKLDIGGFLVTLYRLVTDYEFIKSIEQEFIMREFDKLIQG